MSGFFGSWTQTAEARESNRQLSKNSVMTPMPLRFYDSEDGDYAKAYQRWDATFRWRAEMHADLALDEPHPEYELIKKCYPHYFCGHCKEGYLCYYVQPGGMNVQRMKDEGISEARFLWHIMWCLEYVFTHIQRRQTDRLFVILDMGGVSMGDLVGDVMALVKKAVGMMGTHYPERSFKICILNVPAWFNVIFKAIKPLLRKKTQDKIGMCRKGKVRETLLALIPEDQLPAEYGGTSKVFLSDSVYEQQMLRRVHKVLRAHEAGDDGQVDDFLQEEDEEEKLSEGDALSRGKPLGPASSLKGRRRGSGAAAPVAFFAGGGGAAALATANQRSPSFFQRLLRSCAADDAAGSAKQ